MNIALKMKILTSGKCQLWLARRVGVSEATLSKIVGGWRNPPPELQARIARALECDPKEIFSPQIPSPEENTREAELHG